MWQTGVKGAQCNQDLEQKGIGSKLGSPGFSTLDSGCGSQSAPLKHGDLGVTKKLKVDL